MVFAQLVVRSTFGAVRSASRSQVRALSSSAVASKDFVQELYVKELKGYKAPPKAADSHKGQVREFQTPSAPKAPAVLSSSELSSQLEAYAAAEPDHAEAVASSSSEGALTEGGDVNAFLREAAADVKVEAHH
ncbi:hypothetical protein NDA11_006372 [Ustilago hordei]|uniref:Uncharacterized protein n=1 Tax=Ustilago hordei TaxID=120017 RepID=I2FY25_USTHO|nr:uncharacterized protein UHO2_00307 [Ustilago hordei]KAJ1041301.1 hypothetical protein NDA10_006180 [Ustilago hordei]KAJ1570984.1 hypothetical protein NDA11_006372 [Ustilago hordei]KAJ1587305.1 hypothetical protein NDA15_004231 [Ustilago hordei]KAJ1590218.1 hypothetical protein NDA12_005140 [Ustilago hordei]KAJ1602551.1 hypothetical protein NDA14_006452 [Ustilago hordei]